MDLRTTEGLPHRESARAWLDADDPDRASSFVNICIALDLDPDGVRRHLAARIAA